MYEVQKPAVVVGRPVASRFGQPRHSVRFQLPKSVQRLVKDVVLEKVAVKKDCSTGDSKVVLLTL
jgi:hypothetical protein